METFVTVERHPNLIKFCDEYKDQVKSFICNFESVENAKSNLQNKMDIAFTTVRGKNKRGPGIDIDLKALYAEARAMSSITATGSNTLAAAVEQSGNAYILNQVS